MPTVTMTTLGLAVVGFLFWFNLCWDLKRKNNIWDNKDIKAALSDESCFEASVCRLLGNVLISGGCSLNHTSPQKSRVEPMPEEKFIDKALGASSELLLVEHED